VCVVYLSCRLLFVLKYFTSLKTASKAAEKASRRHKTRYDLKVRNSVLKQGDRDLLKHNQITGKPCFMSSTCFFSSFRSCFERVNIL
jgi:hypothetical protein